ncbi:MAG: CocE/NonD family hydrolase C-terminal non-catalytic domain-containing protein [Gammaproteobacteria bacterium]
MTPSVTPSGNLFRAGRRIRVSIASSNFPKHDRNPNTGHVFGESAILTVAHQIIFHDHQRPSHIVLPVIPRSTRAADALDKSLLAALRGCEKPVASGPRARRTERSDETYQIERRGASTTQRRYRVV